MIDRCLYAIYIYFLALFQYIFYRATSTAGRSVDAWYVVHHHSLVVNNEMGGREQMLAAVAC
jgi:hypothetical protein